MKKIFFVRHGETEANLAGLISGGEHDTSLTAKGRAQAKQAGQDLKSKKIEVIVCSHQSRAQETAKIIAAEIGYDLEKILVNELFAETYMGSYSGQKRDILLADEAAGSVKDDIESPEAHHSRISKALDFVRGLEEQNILVVSHGWTGRMVKLIAQKLPHSEFHSIERLQNCEVFEFDLED